MATKRRHNGAIALMAIPAALTASAAITKGAHAQATAVAGAELRILSPDPAQPITTDTFALDVSFKSRTKSPVTTAELWVDGIRWVRRSLETPQMRNVLSFEVDASTLPEGLHTFMIKTVSADGSVSQTELKSQLIKQSPLKDALGDTSSGLGPEMTFLKPLDSRKVAGSVEIMVEAKPKAGINPYVTFYVDKQFKTLKNYPPYNYVWDSTTVPNGFHVIEATGYLDSTNATTTRKMRVWVDNAGGNTVKQNDIPDLSGKTATSADTASLTLAPAPRKAVKVAKKPTPAVKGAVRLRTGTNTTAAGITARPVAIAPAAVRPVTPRPIAITPPAARPVSPRPVKLVKVPAAVGVPAVAAPVTPRVATANKVTPLPLPTASLAAPSAKVTPDVKPMPLGVATTDSAVELPLVPAPKLRSARAKIASPGTLAQAQPSSPLAIRRTGFSARTPRPITTSVPVAKPIRASAQATPRAIVRPQAAPVLDTLRADGKLQVAFNGTRIAFDVQPRVEAGLPIAPFRQIFEHTGGQVMWVKETQVVRAVNADREIVIKVGQKTATVNGQTLTMERAAALERGRTIVPLNFVGKALDVDVKYDPATGRLQITSKN